MLNAVVCAGAALITAALSHVDRCARLSRLNVDTLIDLVGRYALAYLAINVVKRFSDVVTGARQVCRTCQFGIRTVENIKIFTVCGEDCTIQICPQCAPGHIKTSVVDFIMQRTLEDVDPDQGSLDELLIRLPKCQHVFTVETLDGHCGMTDYYQREEPDGRWLRLKEPPIGFKSPPTCPTCRTAITSPRYGRVFKRADLDILELNVASQMSRSLERVKTSIQSFSKANAEAALTNAATGFKLGNSKVPGKTRKARNKARTALLKAERDVLTPEACLNPGNKQYHGCSDAGVKLWRECTQALMNVHTQAVNTAATRSAHLNAWEAAFSCLYEQEMDLAIGDPTRAPRKPAEYAMRAAKSAVGQPRPRADKRFAVEAMWLTIDIRFLLADLTQAWLKAASNKGSSHTTEEHSSWATYINFVLRTCQHDAQIALNVTEASESRRQMTRSHLYLMRAELELFRFNFEMSKQKGTLKDQREELAVTASEKGTTAETSMKMIVMDHVLVLSSIAEHQWLQENFIGAAQTIVDEWRSIERTIRMDTFYQPVSIEEKMEIVKSMGFCKWHLTLHRAEC